MNEPFLLNERQRNLSHSKIWQQKQTERKTTKRMVIKTDRSFADFFHRWFFSSTHFIEVSLEYLSDLFHFFICKIEFGTSFCDFTNSDYFLFISKLSIWCGVLCPGDIYRFSIYWYFSFLCIRVCVCLLFSHKFKHICQLNSWTWTWAWTWTIQYNQRNTC